MTPITQAPLVEYVLTTAPKRARCFGCAKLAQDAEGFLCTDDSHGMPCGLHSVFSVVPSGFSDGSDTTDEDDGHGA